MDEHPDKIFKNLAKFGRVNAAISIIICKKNKFQIQLMHFRQSQQRPI